MADETVTFGLKIDADAAPAKESAAELEKFRAAIEKSQESIAAYRKSLGLLRGSSDEVADAKAKLRAAIAAEQAAVTKNNLAILKLSGSYDRLQKAHKKDTDALAAGKKAIAATGGPLKGLSDNLEKLKGVLSEVSSGWGVLAVAVVAGTAVLAAATIAVAGLLARFTEWVVVSGDALRNMQLMREAASGNEKNATAWGHQIDWLSLKLATSKDKLNELVIETEKALRGTRVSGKGMVDIWSAVAQAGAAMGDDVGRALGEILQRGKLTGRFGIDFKAPGISELQGLGITFQQVAAQLAKDLNIGLDEAAAALVSHRVTLDAGAKAVREVVEKRFGDINAKKLLSLGGIFTKLQDNVRDWAQDLAQPGSALEPLLRGMKQLVDLTGLQTESGQQLKKVVGEYAQALSNAFTENLPLMKQLLGAALDFGAWVVGAAEAVVDFGTSWVGVQAAKGLLIGLGAVLGVIAVAVAAVGAAVWAVGEAFLGLWETGKWIGEALFTIFGNTFSADYWRKFGQNIPKGLIDGLTDFWERAKSAYMNFGNDLLKGFKSVLGIASPSKKTRWAAHMTGEGWIGGIKDKKAEAQAATLELAAIPTAPVAPSGGPGSSSSPSAAPVAPSIAPTIKVEFHIQGVGAEHMAETLKSPSILDGITHAVQVALRGAGIPTGVAVAAGG